MSINEFGEQPRTIDEELRRNAAIEANRFPWKRPSNVRPSYQNTSDAIEIAAKALALAASNAVMEGAPPNVVAALRSNAARLCALRIEVMKGTS